MNEAIDGGPAFPCAEDHKVAADLPWTCGMSKRELFAAIAMHGVMVEPISGSNSLAQYLAQTEPGDVEKPGARMARAAVTAADALLDALETPRPVQYRELYASEQRRHR